MLKKLFSKDEINDAVKRLASLIENDYHDEKIVFVCLLKGSFMFTSDLIRHVHNPSRVDFLRASSYGSGTNSKGEVTITKDIEEGIEGENVIIVEEPKSLRICALLDKRARRKVEIDGDYIGFTIDDGFVVGYGIDFAEQYRNFPEIYLVVDG